MASRPITPSHDGQTMSALREGSLPTRPYVAGSKLDSDLDSGIAGSSLAHDHDYAPGAPRDQSVLSQSAPYSDAQNAEYRPTSAGVDAPEVAPHSQTNTPSRGGTLKKKASVKRTASLMRSTSRRSSRAGSVKSMTLGEKEKYGQSEETNSIFYTPVPISGNPTELLSNRFQAWRKVLKDLIAYFKDIQKAYDGRSKSLLSASNVINNTSIPPEFLTSGGLGDALHMLRDYNKQSLAEGSKAKEIETEIILQLTGLRSDLQQKIKEIKSLSGDFKSSVPKEQENTKKAIRSLQDALGTVGHDMGTTAGKGDPFIVKMGVDRQVEKQIEEENYLHRAYLNLESSGRELESIVVGEIQKAYSAYAGILKREADEQYQTSEKLREGPLAIPKDHEWDTFVAHSDQMVDPRVPVRSAQHITYPGKDHPAATEIKSGMLERKSKYLKNYTPGWYVLSPTHLHEFKSADRIASQTPIMSLYLSEQKLGSHSEPGSSSHKFMLKGRQTGSMHRGHTWILRAETHDTMMAWFADIKELTETTPSQRNEFVRRTHARSLSGNSTKAASIGGSSDGGMEEDEADRVPYSSEQSVRGDSVGGGARAGVAAGVLGAGMAHDNDDTRSEAGWRPPQRPSPGGRFPSDVNVTRGLQAPGSPSSGDSEGDRTAIVGASVLSGNGQPYDQIPHVPNQTQYAAYNTNQATPTQTTKNDQAGAAGSASPTGQVTQSNPAPGYGSFDATQYHGGDGGHEGEWLAPIAAGVGGAAVGAGAMHHHNQQYETDPLQQGSNANAVPYPTSETDATEMPVVAGGSVTDSPTHTRAGTLSSTGDTTGSSSTVPTSVGQNDGNYFDTSGRWVAAHTNYDSATGQAITPQMGKVEALGIRPAAFTAKSVNTISDLHVPGEFPKGTS